MARVTLKDLQEQLKKNDNIINWQQNKIQELQELNEKILNNKNSVSKEEHEALVKQFESLQDNFKEIKALYEHEKERNSILINKCTKLEKELAELQKKEKTKHNERGAGRKRTLTNKQLENIQMLHKQGLSYGAIAKEVGFSKAYVYKLINVRNNV